MEGVSTRPALLLQHMKGGDEGFRFPYGRNIIIIINISVHYERALLLS